MATRMIKPEVLAVISPLLFQPFGKQFEVSRGGNLSRLRIFCDVLNPHVELQV